MLSKRKKKKIILLNVCLINVHIMVLIKEFDPDLEELGKDFTSEENKAKKAAYKANYTREQKQKVYDA